MGRCKTEFNSLSGQPLRQLVRGDRPCRICPTPETKATSSVLLSLRVGFSVCRLYLPISLLCSRSVCVSRARLPGTGIGRLSIVHAGRPRALAGCSKLCSCLGYCHTSTLSHVSIPCNPCNLQLRPHRRRCRKMTEQRAPGACAVTGAYIKRFSGMGLRVSFRSVRPGQRVLWLWKRSSLSDAVRFSVLSIVPDCRVCGLRLSGHFCCMVYGANGKLFASKARAELPAFQAFSRGFTVSPT